MSHPPLSNEPVRPASPPSGPPPKIGENTVINVIMPEDPIGSYRAIEAMLISNQKEIQRLSLELHNAHERAWREFDYRFRRLCVENKHLREAITPSSQTKAAYMGEFSFSIPDGDEDDEERTRNVDVPWTTIKEIMVAMRKRAENSY